MVYKYVILHIGLFLIDSYWVRILLCNEGISFYLKKYNFILLYVVFLIYSFYFYYIHISSLFYIFINVIICSILNYLFTFIICMLSYI